MLLNWHCHLWRSQFQRETKMNKFLVLCAGVLLFVSLASSSQAQQRHEVFPAGSFCDDVNSGLCTDLAKGTNYEGQYSGHDEPAVVFYSDKPGSSTIRCEEEYA